LKLALRGALTSANFLYLVERDPDPSSTAVHEVDELELANRLSYFIWSSTPDEELTGAATRHELRGAQVLSSQLARMLADPKASALVTNFATQWLFLGKHDVDLTSHPMVNPMLNDS